MMPRCGCWVARRHRHIGSSNYIPTMDTQMRAVQCVRAAAAATQFAHSLQMSTLPIPSIESDEVRNFSATVGEKLRTLVSLITQFSACVQVLVQVCAASLNPIDYKMCDGWMEMVVSYPFTPGFDFAGRVVRVGAACERLHVGDQVYGMTRWQTTGCLAEYVAVREAMTALKVHISVVIERPCVIECAESDRSFIMHRFM